jgi:hypothetical protein
MATVVTFNGVSYSVPAVNEEDWESLSNYLVALQNAAVSGGPKVSNIRVSTSATTAVATTDYAVLINYAGAATVNLPAGATGQVFVIADVSGAAATNNITINRNGANTILGGTSLVLDRNNEVVILAFSGGNWYRVGDALPNAVSSPASTTANGIMAFTGTDGKFASDLGVGTADDVLVTNGTTPSFAKIVNANVDGAAAIAYSKLALTNSIVNADVSSSAAIAYSKLNLTGHIVNSDINGSANIAYSKLNLTNKIDNSDIKSSAAIDYSKLNLTGHIVNTDINASAAIAYSKLALTGSIVDADINASAAIAYSKLALTGSLVNADVNASAAIAYSKLALTGSIVDADINVAAAIAYSKLALTGSIVNADIDASAAISYSKLALTSSIVNADINASAAIARTKIASGSASHVVVNDGAGALSSVATLPVSQGGTGLTAIGSALQVLRVDSGGTALEFATLAAGSGDVLGPSSSVTNGIVQFASTTGKAIKDLGVGSANQVLITDGTAPSFGLITDAYIDASAAIAISKLATLTASRALETSAGGLISASTVTSTELGYVSGVTSSIQTQLNGKLPLTGGTLTGALTVGGSLTFNTGGSAADYRIWRSGPNMLMQYSSSGAFQLQDSSFNRAILAADTGYVFIGSSSNTTSPHSIITGGVFGLPVVYIENAGEFESTIGWRIIGNNTVSFLGASSTESLVVYNSSKTIKHLSISSAGDATFSGAVTLSNNLIVDTDTLFVDASANRVGVGTATPLYQFEVRQSAEDFAAITTNSSTVSQGTGLYLRTTSEARISVGSNAKLSFYDNGPTGTENGSISGSGAWTLGPAPVAATNGVLHKIATGDQGATIVLDTSLAGYVQFSNAASGSMQPSIVGVTSDANVPGLGLFSATSNSNTNADMVFDVRENDATDFSTLTTDAFRWRRSNNVIGSVTRAGAWTLGPSSAASTTHIVNGGISNISSITAQPTEIGRSDASTSSGVMGITKFNTTVANTRLVFGYASTNTTQGTARGYIRVNSTSNNLEFEGTSDRRIKTAIEDLQESSLARLAEVRVRKYEMREFPGVVGTGFIAQELNECFPELVTQTDDGQGETLPEGQSPWTISEAGFTPHLIKAIQELAAKVEALEAAS